MAIGVPTGIKIFNWLATMWGGKIHFKTPMLFCIGVSVSVPDRRATGIMLSAAPFDWQLGNSYFVVAHFHYVIVGGILFALFGAFYYWFPKMTGKDVQRNAGQAALLAVRHRLPPDVRFHAHPGTARHAATNLHLRARPRLGHLESDRHDRRRLSGRRPSWCSSATWSWSYFKGKTAGNDPWDAWTLEWSTSSPPPAYNFATIPVVQKPPPAVGSEASGRSGLEVRSSGAPS